MLVLYGLCPNSFRHPPPSVKQTNVEKSAPILPGKPLHPRAMWEKKCPKPSWQALTAPPYGQCPYGNNTFQKGASLSQESLPNNQQFDKLAAVSVTFFATCLLFIGAKCFKSEDHPIPRIIAKDWDDKASPYHIVSLPPAFHLMPSRQKNEMSQMTIRLFLKMKTLLR